MPRHARIKSENGLYHIMLRGINRQQIFNDEEDYNKLIETLVRYKGICKYKIYAYCIMSNHVHLLIKTEKEDIDLIMKRIAGSYVYWYNRKYYRTGHLFQDRFKSEPVDNDEYFLTVLRYIHQNPLKAKITENITEYKYCSYNDYLNDDNHLVDINFALAMMSKQHFVEFNVQSNEDVCLEFDSIVKLNDSDARRIMQQICGCDNVEEFQTMDQITKADYICQLKENGLSIRQICRITGEKFSMVRKH